MAFIQRVCICMVSVFCMAAAAVLPQAMAADTVRAIVISGEIDGSQAALVQRSITQAEENNDKAVMVIINTQGGRVASALKIRDTLQQNGGLTGARDALHEQHRHVRIADDEVLLLLNRLRDGLHLIAPLLRERVDQQQILQRDFRVEIRLQHIPLQIELPAKLQVHRNLTIIDHIGGLAQRLVVVHLRDRASPVDDLWLMMLV